MKKVSLREINKLILRFNFLIHKMRTNFKINTATFICFAFILRLLFINVGNLSALNNYQSFSYVKQHSILIKKQCTEKQFSDKVDKLDDKFTGICEKDSDDDYFKIKSPILSQDYFNTFIYSNGQKHILKTVLQFSKYTPIFPLPRYITFSVFRI